MICGECGGLGRWMGLHWNFCKPCAGTGKVVDAIDQTLRYLPNMRAAGLDHEIVHESDIGFRFQWVSRDFGKGKIRMANRVDRTKTPTDSYVLRFAMSTRDLDTEEAWDAAEAAGFAPATIWHGLDLIGSLRRWPHVRNYVFLGSEFSDARQPPTPLAVCRDQRGTGLVVNQLPWAHLRTVYVMIEQPGDDKT